MKNLINDIKLTDWEKTFGITEVFYVNDTLHITSISEIPQEMATELEDKALEASKADPLEGINLDSHIERMIETSRKEGREINEDNVLGFLALSLCQENETIIRILTTEGGKKLQDAMAERVYHQLRG